MKIATHSGTGMQVIETIFSTLGHDVTVVSRLSDAYHVDFDGLLLLGGTDVNPWFYGERNVHSQRSDNARDDIEWVLARRAITMEVPIMGICRGAQMLAIASGGSLYQDIGRQMGRNGHMASNHNIVDVRRPLHGKIPSKRVNSYHHQAVRRVPHGFGIVAKSHDGVVEAIWRPGALGVQWHPELMFPYDHRWIRLFEWFTMGLR